MSGLWALFWLEIRTAVRDRNMQAMFLISALSAGAVLPGIDQLKSSKEPDEVVAEAQPNPAPEAQPKPDDSGPPVPEDPCVDGDLPAIVVDGELPEDVIWPGSITTAEEANVRLIIESRDKRAPLIRVAKIDGLGNTTAVKACLDQQIGRARLDRYQDLGLPAYPTNLTQPVLHDPPESGPEWTLPPISVFGTTMGIIAMLIAGTLAIEAVPRRRASGLFEQLRSTQTSERELVWAWVLSLTAMMTLLWLASAAIYLPIAFYYGKTELLEHGLHAPFIAAIIGAASIRTSLHAHDIQSATLRWFGVLFALGGFTALSGYWIAEPWLAALVPLGGSVLASTGVLGPAGFLSDIAAVGWTAAIVAWCAHSLRNEDSATAGVDPSLQRQAQGNYLPEAMFLAALGTCTAILSGGAGFAGNLWLGVTFAFVSFMLLPSILAAPVLGLPMSELLPMGRPKAKDIVLAAPVTIGMWGLSTVIVAASMAVMPHNEIVEQFMSGMQDLVSSPLAAVAIGLYPAICEEFLFRGAIMGLLLRGGSTRRAIVLQAAAFSVAHIVSIRLPWTFAFGLLMGWIRARTGSLWACMALHFCFNFFMAGVLPMFFGVASTEFGWTEVLYALPLLLGLTALPLYSRSEEAPAAR